MLIRRTAALSGLADENMTRGNNWLFFDLGRRIERTLAACWLVRHTLAVADERESGAIQVALEIADSAMTYSYRYRNAFQPAPAIDLLVARCEQSARGRRFRSKRSCAMRRNCR